VTRGDADGVQADMIGLACGKLGVPQSAKMGKIASPWRYSLFLASIVKTATSCDVALCLLGWSLYLNNLKPSGGHRTYGNVPRPDMTGHGRADTIV